MPAVHEYLDRLSYLSHISTFRYLFVCMGVITLSLFVEEVYRFYKQWGNDRNDGGEV